MDTELTMWGDNKCFWNEASWSVLRLDLWPGKLHWMTWRSETPILFKVLFLDCSTFLTVIPPLLEEFQKCLFGNGVQLSRHIQHNFSWCHLGPFQQHFVPGKQPQITSSHVRSLMDEKNVVGQERLNEMGLMGRCTVMVELPSSSWLQVLSFA